ncbi:MAG: hypothetical protein AB1505_33820 [Candidatus Latescibacterota bacterium]
MAEGHPGRPAVGQTTDPRRAVRPGPGWEGCPPQEGWRELPRDPQDAVILENDVLGVRLWGPPEQPTLSLGKSDIWDRRWRGDRQPPVTLAQIRRCACEDRLAEIARAPNDTVYSPAYAYDFPCPKTGAQLILGLPFALSAQLAPARPTGWWLWAEGNGRRLEAHIWVPLARVLVVVEMHPQGLEPADLWLRLYRHRDTILPGQPVDPTLGGKPSPGDFEPMDPPRVCPGAWAIRQDFPAELTFPRGFRVVAMAGADGPAPAVEQRQDEVGLGTLLWAPQEGRLDHGVVKCYTPINQAPGAAATARFPALPASLTVLATLQTTQDAPEPEAAARQVLEAALANGLAGLQDEENEAQQSCLRPHPAQAWIGGERRLAAPARILPSLRRPGGYYGDVPLCSVGPTRVWFQDAGLWHNDFHLNEIRAESLLTLGCSEQVAAFADMIHTLLPQACQNAREVYDLPGAMYPLVHFPLRCQGVAHTNLTWEQDIGLNGLVAKPLWLYYRYTGDRAFLQHLAWPVLAACARFCAAYLREEIDGRLHLEPTVSPEHWGLTPGFERNRDCTSALTLTRYLLRAAAAAARSLGIELAAAQSWEAKAGRLAPFPTFPTPSGPVWVDVAGAPPIEYNIPVSLSPVFWGDEVGLDSEPGILAVARRTLEQIQVWPPHRFYLDACVRPRLGIHVAGAPVGPENLLLSYQSLRLFPAAPAGVETDVQDFAAQGGFRVSARRSADGEVSGVRLHSLLGETCRLAHPWPGRTLRVRQERGGDLVAAAVPQATHVSFATAAGTDYRVDRGPTEG